MANPQKENGYTAVANEILDEVIKRIWTKRQLKILMVVWRFSYGYDKKVAYFDKMEQLRMYDITDIRNTLVGLEEGNVLKVNWQTGSVRFLKDYTKWNIDIARHFLEDEHKALVKYNMSSYPTSKSGWGKYRRQGSGRKANFDSQNMNQSNEVRFTKHESVDSQNVNQLIHKTRIKQSGKSSDSVALGAAESNRKQVKAIEVIEIDAKYGLDEESVYDDLVEHGILKGVARIVAHNNDGQFIITCLEKYQKWVHDQKREEPAYLMGIIKKEGGKTNAS